MTMHDLRTIIFSKLKANKSGDLYKLTVEHLLYCGEDTHLVILIILNKLIDNINFLSSPQLNTALASVVYKGKNKSIYDH